MFQLEAEQHFLGVGEVADDAPQGRRQLLDQRGRRENLVLLGELRMCEDIDDLEVVAAGQIVLADALEVLDGERRARRGSGDIELEQELVCQARPPKWTSDAGCNKRSERTNPEYSSA